MQFSLVTKGFTFSRCSYDYVVEKQPIGKLLFEQFCNTIARYASAWSFLCKVEEYETSDDDGESRRLHAEFIASMLSSDSETPCVSSCSTLY